MQMENTHPTFEHVLAELGRNVDDGGHGASGDVASER